MDGVQLHGSVLLTFIVYVVPLFPLTTVSAVSVPVQVVYHAGFVELYGVYHNADITPEQLLIVPVQVVYPHQLDNWQLSVGIVGVPVKSQYFQLVATVHKVQVLA